MANSLYILINKIIKYSNKCIDITKDITKNEYLQNEDIIMITVFCISQIGELSKHIDQNICNKYCNINWKGIKSVRNRIVHDYDGINQILIWTIINEDLPILILNLEEIKNKENLC